MRTAVLLGLSLLVSASAGLAQTDTISTLPAEALIDSGPPEPIRDTSPCTIQRITDGDTIECTEVGRVRLIGVDTPGLSQEPYGQLASEALAELVPVGSRVELERDVELQDQYGRMLAYVWIDGLQVNWVMVRQGWAVLLTYPPNVQYVDWYTEAQRRAREDGVGLWAVGGFDCRPVDRRRGRCD
jgi:micrococcal nuclease